MRSRFATVLWGIIFITVGIFYAGDIFNLWDFKLFFHGWWTLFIIIPCLINIVENGFGTGNVKTSSIPIFGGAANKTRPCINFNAPTIYINATCIFGGLDSK